MPMIKPKEIRDMRPEDVKAKFKELSDELMHERGVAAMGGAPASPGRIRSLRTEIARIHTIMREKELAKMKAAKKTPVVKASKPKKEEKKQKNRAERPKKEEKK